jgi:hypothetical protein
VWCRPRGGPESTPRAARTERRYGVGVPAIDAAPDPGSVPSWLMKPYRSK